MSTTTHERGMTVQQARAAIARLREVDQWTPAESADYEAAAAALVAAGWCPNCAGENPPHHAHLGRYEAPTADTYGGRTCCDCEEFYQTGEQRDGPGYETEPEWRGDADPGL